ncbi:MAG: CDP-glycerol glycerophosphotransferase family protein [Candidatus Spechtbacteria bacterium]|nr:CDP-glycerol glycerophosphotransferase family protein [Candidatus Spechtbacteria bacterium]
MQTIFITIHDGEIAKNIFRTDVWKILKASPDLRFVLLAQSLKKEYYERQFGGSNVIVEEFPEITLSVLARSFHALFRHALPVTSTRLWQEYMLCESKKNILAYLVSRTVYILAHIRLMRNMFRWIGMFFLPVQSLQRLFDQYHPKLVFATNILAYEDINLIREAKKHGVRAVSMSKSWDTMSSKGLLRIIPDYFIVQNNNVKDEAVRFHNFRDSQIFVSGMPQYDTYFKRGMLVPREEFFRSVGLDFKKKFIFYCAIGDWLAPDEHEVVEIIDKAIEAGHFKFPAQILARPHPKYRGIDDKLKNCRHTIVDRAASYPGARVEDWEFEEKDISHLINSIAHCDVLVTTASTMSIEGCIFNKPVINIAFDGYQKKPYELSVARFYDQHHYKPITMSGGVKIVKSEEELVHALNDYLQDPSLEGCLGKISKNFWASRFWLGPLKSRKNREF